MLLVDASLNPALALLSNRPQPWLISVRVSSLFLNTKTSNRIQILRALKIEKSQFSEASTFCIVSGSTLHDYERAGSIWECTQGSPRDRAPEATAIAEVRQIGQEDLLSQQRRLLESSCLFRNVNSFAARLRQLGTLLSYPASIRLYSQRRTPSPHPELQSIICKASSRKQFYRHEPGAQILAPTAEKRGRM